MDLLCGQKWVCSVVQRCIAPPQLSCVNNSQSFTRSRKSCVDWPVPAHHMCVSEHIQRACTQYLIHAPHTSTTDYVVLSSRRFIRLRLWCGKRSLRNTVLGKETEWICAPRKRLAIDPPCVSWSLLASVCCFQSLTPPHLSVLPPTSIITIFSPHFRWRSLFPLLYTLFFQPTPTPLVSQLQVIWARQCSQLISLRNHLECCSNLWSSGLQGSISYETWSC